MAELLVVRAGTTDYDVQGRIRGNLDLPLTAAGRDVAGAVADRLASLAPAALYASRARCATETAAIIGRRVGLVPRRSVGLEGLDLGLWQGMLASDLRRRQPRLARHWQEDPWTVVPPEGEPLSLARQRVGAAIGVLLARHPGGRVMVVVPRPLDRVIGAVLEASDPGDLWDTAGDDEPVAAFRVADGRSPRSSSAPHGDAIAEAVGAVPRGWFGLSFP